MTFFRVQHFPFLVYIPRMPFRIGQVELASNLFLAPLAGYTNLPFRLVIREIGGAGLCTTDLVNARSLLEKNRKALKLIESRPVDRPLAIQLFGSVPEEMRDAALFLESQNVSIVDINMGCPVRKVCKVGGGSAMMTEQDKTLRLIKTMVDSLKIPVTCKMRLGWDDTSITAPDFARALEDVGVAAITIHGRTREQGFSGGVNLAGIRAVVQAIQSIPVVGNGDITNPREAERMFEETGCAAISIGRGAFYNPWIFQHARHYLATGELPTEPDFEDRIKVVTRHLDLMVEIFGEELGCRMFRKVGPWYAKRFGPAAEFNRQIVGLNSRAEFDAVVASYRIWRQRTMENRMQFRTASTPEAVKTDEHAPVAARASIPTPKGPIEWW